MKKRLYPILENFFSGLESWASRMRERFAICQDCGQNRFSGIPCVKFNSQSTQSVQKGL